MTRMTRKDLEKRIYKIARELPININMTFILVEVLMILGGLPLWSLALGIFIYLGHFLGSSDIIKNRILSMSNFDMCYEFLIPVIFLYVLGKIWSLFAVITIIYLFIIIGIAISRNQMKMKK